MKMETALHPTRPKKQFARPSVVPMSDEEYLSLPDEEGEIIGTDALIIKLNQDRNPRNP
jgi:hypothetical protein